jgi:hypothetical protein
VGLFVWAITLAIPDKRTFRERCGPLHKGPTGQKKSSNST